MNRERHTKIQMYNYQKFPIGFYNPKKDFLSTRYCKQSELFHAPISHMGICH